ncbi:MAG: hypothetical protein ACO3SP_01155 [Ilumatobacteraceae bacterium]
MDDNTARATRKPVLAPGIGAHHRLTRGWSRTMVTAWLIMGTAVVAVGSSSHVIGRPVFWLDDQRWGLIGAVLMTAALAVPFGAVLVVSYLEGPFIPYIGSLITVELTVLAILDRHRSPGAAVVIGVLAGAGLLLTVASFGGRLRRSAG